MKRRTFVRNLGPSVAAITTLGTRGATARLRGLGDAVAGLSGDDLWDRIRAEFMFSPGILHFNTATLGAVPRVVLDAVTAAMHEIEGNPAANVFGPVGARMQGVQEKAARFLGAAPEEVMLTRNTTEGMNLVAQGLALQAGDEVLTTNHEHPGGRLCWDYLARHHGVKVVEMEMPMPAPGAAAILEGVEAHLTDRTRVCSFSHVSTVTGIRMPLAEIAALVRPRGILLVCDGAQAPGMLQVDVEALGVDAYASSSHKWMLAPKGCGLLYIRRAAQEQIRPLPLQSGFEPYTGSFGTRNVAQILGHGTAMDFHETIGRDRVESRCLALAARLRAALEEMPAFRVISGTSPALATGIVSVALRRGNNREAAAALKERGIIVKVIPIAAYNGLRFSTHIFNNEADLARLLEALAAVV